MDNPETKIRRQRLRLWFSTRPIPKDEKSYLSQLMGGKAPFGEKAARRLEKDYGMGKGWLDQPSDGNTEPGPDVVGRLPLISQVQAGMWSEIFDNFAPGDAEDWLPCPVKHGPNSFVLRVKGESMYNPHGLRSFKDGDLIFCDPNRIAVNNSLVVVKLEDENEATFKQLVIDGEKKYLKALNPGWPEPIIQINGNAKICGVVVFRGESLI